MVELRASAEDEVGLQHYLAGLRRRRWPILLTTLVVLAVGAAMTAMTTPIYQVKAKLLIRASGFSERPIGDASLADLLTLAQPETLETQLEVLRSRPFLREVYEASRLPAGQPAPSIGLTNLKGTNIIVVSAQGPDGEVAARVANTLLDQYMKRSSVLSRQEVTQAREFVEKQAQNAREGLQKAEAALSRVRRSSRKAELTAEQTSRAQAIVQLEARIHGAYDNIVRVQAQMREVQAQLDRQPRIRSVNAVEVNPRFTALQAKLAEAVVERNTLLHSYQPGSQKLRAVDALLANLKTQIATEPPELRVTRHAVNAKYDVLVDKLDAYRTELQGLEAQHQQLRVQLGEQRERIGENRRQMQELDPSESRVAQLQRERDMSEKSYLRLAGKLEDLQIRESSHHVAARIIERALPSRSPVHPRKSTNLTMSLALGLLLGCSLAFLLEALDERITTPEEIDRHLGLPVLGCIPAIAGDRRLLHLLPPHSPVAESYRALRSGIRFSAVDPALTTLAISSTLAGEGKSLNAINLAFAMAMDGRQVILVDTDLRQPNLHRLLDLHSSPGLTDVLTGQCTLEDALQAIPDHQLLVLTSGPIPPNPAELLNTAEMEELIRQLRQHADLIIFDTPPCVPFTDAQVLGTKLDGVLLVAEIGGVRQADLRLARELFDQAHVRIVGVLANKISHQRVRHYWRHPYYRDDATANGSGNGYHDGSPPADDSIRRSSPSALGSRETSPAPDGGEERDA